VDDSALRLALTVFTSEPRPLCFEGVSHYELVIYLDRLMRGANRDPFKIQSFRKAPLCFAVRRAACKFWARFFELAEKKLEA